MNIVEALRKRVQSSVLAARLADAEASSEKWLCFGCQTPQPVDDEMRFGLHMQNLIWKKDGAPTATVAASGVCPGSLTQVPSAREAWVENAIEEQTKLFTEIRDLLKGKTP